MSRVHVTRLTENVVFLCNNWLSESKSTVFTTFVPPTIFIPSTHTIMNTLTGPQMQKLADDLRQLISAIEPLVAMDEVPRLDADLVRSQLRRVYEQLYFAPKLQDSTAPAHRPAEVRAEQPKTSAPIADKITEPEVPTHKVMHEAVQTAPIAPVAVNDIPVAEHSEKPTAPISSIAPITEEISQPQAEIIPAPVAEPVKAQPVKVEPVKVEPVKATPVKTEPATAKQPVAAQKLSASEIIAQNMQGNVLANRFQQKPIANIASAIGLNDKFQYIRTLFDNKATDFTHTVAALNAMNSFDDAMQYISTHFEWDMEDPVTIQFLELVNRRFI